MQECSTHECYHSAMEYAISEVIDNQPDLKDIDSGRHITTDLHNYAVPMIRYDSQDYITKYDKKCSCGRNLLPIKRIDGRDTDIIICPNGNKVIVHMFTIYFEGIKEVEQFQIKQQSENQILFFLVVNNDYNYKIELKITNYWQSVFGDNIKISVILRKKLLIHKSGKRKFIIKDY